MHPQHLLLCFEGEHCIDLHCFEFHWIALHCIVLQRCIDAGHSAFALQCSMKKRVRLKNRRHYASVSWCLYTSFMSQAEFLCSVQLGTTLSWYPYTCCRLLSWYPACSPVWQGIRHYTNPPRNLSKMQLEESKKFGHCQCWCRPDSIPTSCLEVLVQTCT